MDFNFHLPQHPVIFLVTCAISFLGAIFAMVSDTISLGIIGAIAAGIAAIPPSIIAYANLQQTKLAVVNAQLEAAKSALALEQVDQKTDVVINKATEIHTLTNSNLAAVTKSLGVALERIEGLNNLILAMSEAKKIADDLSTQKASSELHESNALSPESSTNPIPVKDDQVADLLKGEVTKKLDSIQEDVKPLE